MQITPNVTRTWVTLTFLGTAGKAYRIISTSNPGASLRSWETVTRVTSTGNGLVAVALPVETGIPKFFAYRED
ncbi:MAG: hypothetical protein COV91_03715 [Candidatus Taylorbacteria bacterium CG11_big_fil_rev_8_21_14_0_20_46_11]|uniref:Uncharacterized protein n=1 Tax=Candidatus Taylorbacteria bacterium CG11_big_fil_rev_8_21_14_0_20_46_11 TaxID=1975025 RepID=A0A2H0KBD6_9BACT|nr:MAG: hypothetical protein COV91_03715 [Candidatus Taylorbacteria bacterium CG11_big_fil_rev_8_21_14_0_20_46_11]